MAEVCLVSPQGSTVRQRSTPNNTPTSVGSIASFDTVDSTSTRASFILIMVILIMGICGCGTYFLCKFLLALYLLRQ